MNVSSSRRTRRLLTAIAGLATASVLLSGCLYSLIPDTAPASTASPTPDVEGIAPDLLPFYEQTLDWVGCGDRFDCTTVTAPLDWANPGDDEIELALIRSRAEGGEAIGSLLTNPGGPGVSGVSYVRDSLTSVAGDALRQEYDVIGFDPRGVGDSTAVVCFEDAVDMDEHLFGVPDAPRNTPAWTDELTESARSYAEACEANSDDLLPHLTTENSARDLDLLRAVLGDSELHYLGYSYGTFLGATYAELFPARVGRLVLDGALDPSVPGAEIGITQAIGFEAALRAYMAQCVTDDECPFRGSVDDAMADLGTLLASVERDPLPAADGRMLNADNLLSGIVAALYSPTLWEYLTVALNDALQGDPEVAFLLADSYFHRVDGEYTDNITEAFDAYNCMDYPDDTTPEQQAAAEARIAAEAPTIAPYWGGGVDICEMWPYEATGVRGPITAEGAAPIVVVGSTGDPATPYEWAVSLADQLSSGVLITRVGEGHTGYMQGNDCVDRAVEAYLLEGTVPEDGLRCE